MKLSGSPSHHSGLYVEIKVEWGGGGGGGGLIDGP